jgi:hypothetical protein
MTNPFYTFMYNVTEQAERVRTMRKLATATVLDDTLRGKAEVKLAAAERQLMKTLAPYAKNLGLGAAAAAPAVAGGAYLVNKAKHEAEDLKNQALLGAVGVGGGLITMNHMSNRFGGQSKAASDDDDLEIVNKLAAVVYIDSLLSRLPATFVDYDVPALRAENDKLAADIILDVI